MAKDVKVEAESRACAMQFVDGSSRLLTTAERDSTTGWFGKEDTSKSGAARSLRCYMEIFVPDKFLPAIYLDFRWGMPLSPIQHSVPASLAYYTRSFCACACTPHHPWLLHEW